MSYNFDQCVASIQEHRLRAYANASDATEGADIEALQQSVDGFAALSKYCPMTPLLWMQYAHDTEVLMERLMMLESFGDKGQQKMQMQAKKRALETSTSLLELALAEFPGCSLLHLYYLECLADMLCHCEGLCQMNAQGGGSVEEADCRRVALDRLSTAFETAWLFVGRGTHVNEGMVVSTIYQLHGSFLLFLFSSGMRDLKNESTNHAAKDGAEASAMQQLSTLFQKWSKTPMGGGSNDEMVQDMEYIWEEACSLILSLCEGDKHKMKQKKMQNLDERKILLWADIDAERKITSSVMNILVPYENDVDVAMSNEGILLPWQSLFFHQQDGKKNHTSNSGLGSHTEALMRTNSKWNSILSNESNRFLLGLGGRETSCAFLKHTSSLQRIYHKTLKKKDVSEFSTLENFIGTEHSVISSLYERALSECPTVESLWVAYINFLRGEWARVKTEIQCAQIQQNGHREQQQKELLIALKSSSHRAIRNCPYSVTLFEMRMTTLGLTSVSNLDPDDISAVINEATELGFLNHSREAMLHLRFVAILVVKRRILSLISLRTTGSVDYDQGEDAVSIGGTKKKPISYSVTSSHQPLDPSVKEEVQDLLEEIRDMYDEADTYLFNSHPAWMGGKVSFWRHRALTEAYVLCPIGFALKAQLDGENNAAADGEAIRCFEKLVKLQKPSHPDSWREYIRYVSSSHLYLMGNVGCSRGPNCDNIGSAILTLRMTRKFYHRAIHSVKKAGQLPRETISAESEHSWVWKGIESSFFQRDYDTALLDLCREYLEFERSAGSEESLSHGQTLVRNKLAQHKVVKASAAAMVAPPPNNEEGPHGKRKLDHGDHLSIPNNGSSMMIESHQLERDSIAEVTSKRAKVKTNLKEPKKTDALHKVRIGKMEYPAHPFTIRVSNLDKNTQDMDLVDVFRPNVGAIVHAKIARKKHFGKGGHHYHGESMCSALIQFEERLSVEEALLMDGKLEVGGKVVKIQRSHLPAVGLVPSGMHRVNPKGEGKISRRNQLKKESKKKDRTKDEMNDDQEEKGVQMASYVDGDQTRNGNLVHSSPGSLSLSVLAFKPRGIRQKPKITLKSNKE